MKRIIGTLGMLIAGWCPIAADEVTWFDGAQAVSYQVEGRTAPVVSIALDMFACDMQLVTGQRAVSAKDAPIRIFELDKNRAAADRLRKAGVPVDSIAGKLDAFYIGIHARQILIVGSNGRGCAYGILELSRRAGVSPWVWWGDVRPHSISHPLTLPDSTRILRSPSVAYRGIFINDEDWSLRRWSADDMGPQTYKRLFELLLRLRANTIWPAMHDVSPGFFTVAGNKEMADSFGILIGTSHCEPLLRNNVAEWDVKVRGPYNYITNREAVKDYWAERLKEVKGSEELFTIGMRGIHDGSMEGVKTKEEKLSGLQQVIDDQRNLLRKYYLPKSADAAALASVPQVFIPYKEVLEIMESGLRVPDDVTLMWCDDNYGYLTRLPDREQQQRKGGGGVYYHLSYWGRPHDYLWLTTTQPGLICHEMRQAYDHNCRQLWIVNVHDPKVAAYDLELFLDLAWDINAIARSGGVYRHLERWLCTQFGSVVGKAIAPAMAEWYHLNAIRKPEFMGWTQVELDKKKYPGGKSQPGSTAFSLLEAYQRMEAFARLEATVDTYRPLIPEGRQDAYFAHVLYPVHAAAAMTRKMLLDGEESRRAYEEIQQLTAYYNAMNSGKWRGLMSAAPRNLPVFGMVSTSLPQHPSAGHYVARNACQADRCTTVGDTPCTVVGMLGHSMRAVALPKGNTLTYEFTTQQEGDAVLYTAMIPTQPNDRGDLRYEVTLDSQEPVVISLKEPYRSEFWKQSVLRGQALKKTPVKVTRGRHTLSIKALDDHIVVDQWMLDFNPARQFYVIPAPAMHQDAERMPDVMPLNKD